MARIMYITNARLPTEKAHGLQIMKTCEALVRVGNDLTLIAPHRRNSIHSDTFEYYNIAEHFPLRKLFTIDLIRFGRVGFLIQEFTFALACVVGLLRGKYDFIYGRDEVSLALLSLFGYQKIVWESHDGSWNIFSRLLAHRASKLVVVSEGLREFYVEKGVLFEKIAVIPNAIDPQEFSHPESKEVARRRLGLPLEAKIALYIGRLDGWKGTDTLLEASKYLKGGIKVALIGGESEHISELSKRYPQVIFLGFHPYSELPDNQAAADVLVVPNTGKSEISTRFTSPLKLIAHLSSNRPIVASDLPSIREIVGDDAACLVPADDPQALAVAIEKVLSDTEYSVQLATQARGRARAYTWTSRADAIVGVLKEL